VALEFSTRAYFSVYHIETAALFARQAKAVEVARAGTTRFSLDQWGYVVGSVLSSVAFLEAAINELFADTSDGRLRIGQLSVKPTPRSRRRLTRDTVRLMAEMWEQGIPRTARYSVLEKYAIALSLARKEPMDKGIPPWQPTELLIRLRNALVHYEPTDEPVGPLKGGEHKSTDGEHKLTKALRGRFPLNSLAHSSLSTFPDKILGHGCAAWAVKTSTAFADEFAQRLGITPFYVHTLAKLVTE